ncbi:putative acetyltransferase [Sphingomonas laterariae]|uniref:Putative acetyltransferase n=1 Tax=Edaphosphingomonas laterariae TaxID=861865 RepID=A0A239H863_9SPHN|nr:acetyltransferase [Sphingomonas laterariae]SNS77599.1 putative acetyltransferase [Sphingomonas laterariae]
MAVIRKSRAQDGARNVDIWRQAVRATHDFLTPADFTAIEAMVAHFLPHADLWVAVDANDRPLAFLGMSGAHIDALFVDPACRGTGIGRALITHGAAIHPILTVDVNEQNGQAIGFYERLGFAAFGRSPTDDQGRPYPLLHMRRAAPAG